jgi:hypothetical protein
MSPKDGKCAWPQRAGPAERRRRGDRVEQFSHAGPRRSHPGELTLVISNENNKGGRS